MLFLSGGGPEEFLPHLAILGITPTAPRVRSGFGVSTPRHRNPATTAAPFFTTPFLTTQLSLVSTATRSPLQCKLRALVYGNLFLQRKLIC